MLIVPTSEVIRPKLPVDFLGGKVGSFEDTLLSLFTIGDNTLRRKRKYIILVYTGNTAMVAQLTELIKNNTDRSNTMLNQSFLVISKEGTKGETPSCFCAASHFQ